MVCRSVVCAVLVLCAAAAARAQEPSRSDGWVVIGVEEYRALRLKARPPDAPPEPPPVDATLTRLEYDLRVNGDSIGGQARLTIDVLKEGWVAVQIPTSMLVRNARLDGRTVPLIEASHVAAPHPPSRAGTSPPPATSAPHVLLSKPGRTIITLDVVVPLKVAGGAETLSLPPAPVAVSRVALVVPRSGIDVAVSGGVLAERPQDPSGRWVAYGRAGQPLTLTWKRRVDDQRALQALRWRGSVTQIVGLGEETTPVTATVRVEIVQGVASSVDVAIPEAFVVNQVSGALVADWDLRGGVLKVNFLEPVAGQTSFAIGGEAKAPRDGSVIVPLARLPGAERESGGVAVEVLGAGEIRDRQARGLDPADPSDLGEPLSGRESPSMVAFRFRAQEGGATRSLAVNVERYTPQAVLVANVEEARYEVLAGEEGKTLVRARYAVRNNQRAFLSLTLPPGATLWSAAVAGRPIRPGTSPAGALLVPLEKGRAGDEAPAFAVEVTFVQRGSAWDEKGQATIPLPTIDLPTSRTGVVLHHSPRFRISAEPGAFRLETDPGPFTEALRRDVPSAAPFPPPPPPAPLMKDETASTDDLVAQFQREGGGRAVAGPLPVRMPFPKFGPSVFLVSELTAESQAPTLSFSYKRASRW